MLLEVYTQLSVTCRSHSDAASHSSTTAECDAASHSNTTADLSKHTSPQAASTPTNNQTVREDTQLLWHRAAEILVYPSKVEYLEWYLDGMTHSCVVEAQ